jgi:hypothetical protein
MKSQLISLSFIVGSICFGSIGRADDPLEFTFYLVDNEDALWRLTRFGDRLVFWSMNPRLEPKNSKESSMAGTGVSTIYIEPEGGGDPVFVSRNNPLKTLSGGGTFALSMEGLKYSPKSYLTADFSTDPPTVRVDKKPGKEGIWAFIDSGTLLQAYVEHVGGPDKSAWLALAKSGTTKPAGLKNGQQMVYEFRDAILTAEKIHRIRIDRHYEGK